MNVTDDRKDIWAPAEIWGAMRTGGIHIQPIADWPRVTDGYEMRHIKAHPLVCWLAQYLPIKPYVEVQVTRYKDADALLNHREGVLYCSYAQYEAIKDATSAAAS